MKSARKVPRPPKFDSSSEAYFEYTEESSNGQK